MSYVTGSQLSSIVDNVYRNILKNRSDIDLHSTQLIDLGKKQTKIGQDLTYFGQKVTEIDETNQDQWKNIIFNADRMNELQDQIIQAKQHRDNIESKLSLHSLHRNEKNGCEWYDIPCQLKQGASTVGTYAILGGIGYIAYNLIKRRKK
jgi:hypothetical protein